MEVYKLKRILYKRDNRHVLWICVSSLGNGLLPDDAHELEKLGYGELHGGDNGVFWLYPMNKVINHNVI